MTVADLVQTLGLVVLAAGLGGTWIRSRRNNGYHSGVVATEIENIGKDVVEIKGSVGRVEEKVDNQALNCAKVSTGLAEKVKNLEKARARK